MGCIIHPWNLVIFVVVTCVAAMDVRSVTESRFGPRGLRRIYRALSRIEDMKEKHDVERRSEWCDHFSCENDGDNSMCIPTRHVCNGRTMCPNGADESEELCRDVKLCVKVARPIGSGTTSDAIVIYVEFQSGKVWGGSIRLRNSLWAGANYRFIVQQMLSSRDDPVKSIHVDNRSNDAFFPMYIDIDGPDVSDNYRCNWYSRCAIPSESGIWPSDESACYFTGEREIPCQLANASPSC